MLFKKLALALVLLLFVVGLANILLTQALTDQSYQSGTQQLHRNLAADLAQQLPLASINGGLDLASIGQAFEIAKSINPGIELYVVDSDGRVASISPDGQQIARDSIAMEPLLQFLAGDSMYPLVGGDPLGSGEEMPFSVAPLSASEPYQHYLYAVLQSDASDQMVRQQRFETWQTLSVMALIGSLALGLPLGLWLLYPFSRRVLRLTEAVESFRSTDLAELDRAPVVDPKSIKHRDEIARLETSFNAMSQDILNQYQSLQRQDNLRREMVANVSHDLRTPLTALHGYVERLSEHYETLDDDERKHFLSISLRHSARLGNLITDLFELSRLDASEVTISKEPFALAELVQDVLHRFALRASKAGVDLRLENTCSSTQVNGDIGLIERAISNLIDNAIDYSSSGQSVVIQIGAENEHILIRVIDHGKGIAAEHLPLLFERYYRAEPKLGGDKHAGLGLAITKRILALHDQAIHVRSVLGRGTTFEFALPLQSGAAATPTQ
ncbi:MAG: HAMP domain-containing sensor histidine kinase [Pseudomonadota bacterium]